MIWKKCVFLIKNDNKYMVKKMEDKFINDCVKESPSERAKSSSNLQDLEFPKTLDGGGKEKAYSMIMSNIKVLADNLTRLVNILPCAQELFFCSQY